MLYIAPSRHGRPGDLAIATPPAPLASSALVTPTKTFLGQPVFDLGIHLEEDDLERVRAAMLDAFKVAFPDAAGTPRLPIRPCQNRPAMWVETLKRPVCLDAADQPIPPPVVGSVVKVLFRACPYHRSDERQGVSAYLVKVKLPA